LKRVLIAALITLAACGSPPAQYTPEYEHNFMRACQLNAPTALCACVWTKIAAEIPVAEFEAFERLSPEQRAASPVAAQLRGFATACESAS
jgi:hypothetical protein